MKIKLLCTYRHRDPKSKQIKDVKSGTMMDLEDHRAKAMLDSGHAEPADDKSKAYLEARNAPKVPTDTEESPEPEKKEPEKKTPTP